MPQTVQGVIARAKGAEVELVDIVVPDPGPGEAVVRIEACGVCHTDLHYREGGINDEFPFLLGHEAAGIGRGGRRGRHRRRAGRLRHPQLARRVRPVPRLPQGQALVLLRHPQRDPEDDAHRRHRADARRSASGRSSRRPSWPRASAPRSTARPTPAAVGPARLRRDGRLRCGREHRRRGPRRLRRGDRLRRRRQRRHRRRRAWPGRRRSSPSTSTTGSSRRPAASAPPTRSTRSTEDPVEAIRALTGGHGADVVVEAVGRPETLRAGLLRPRPRRHRRAGRGADARQGDHPAAHRRLRPRWRAEVELVRRLPALARLPDARRPVPPGPLRPRRVRQRADRHRRRRGGLRQDAPRRRAALGRRHGRRA